MQRVALARGLCVGAGVLLADEPTSELDEGNRGLVLAELRRSFGHEVAQTTVGIDTRVRESQAKGLPVGLYAPRCRAAKSYRDLADEVRARLTREVRHAQAA